MERPEAFIEEALDAMYEKAEKEGAIPWNDAEDEGWNDPQDEGMMKLTPAEVPQLEKALGETFPDEP